MNENATPLASTLRICADAAARALDQASNPTMDEAGKAYVRTQVMEMRKATTRALAELDQVPEADPPSGVVEVLNDDVDQVDGDR